MTIQLNLPPEVEKQIGENEQRAALEAVLVEMYRRRKVSRQKLSDTLGLKGTHHGMTRLPCSRTGAGSE